MNSPCNVQHYPWSGANCQRWIFEEVGHKMFTTVGIPDTAFGHNHTGYKSEISNAAASIGYSQWNQVANLVPDDVLWYFDRSSFFVIRSHGTQESVTLSQGLLTRTQIASWDKYRLGTLRLVLYGTCLTGKGGASANNLVNITFDRGARTVIGFQDTVNCLAMNRWTYEFFVAAGERNKNVAEACSDADFWTGVYFAGYHGDTDNRLVRGSTRQKLIY